MAVTCVQQWLQFRLAIHLDCNYCHSSDMMFQWQHATLIDIFNDSWANQRGLLTDKSHDDTGLLLSDSHSISTYTVATESTLMLLKSIMLIKQCCHIIIEAKQAQKHLIKIKLHFSQFSRRRSLFTILMILLRMSYHLQTWWLTLLPQELWKVSRKRCEFHTSSKISVDNSVSV